MEVVYIIITGAVSFIGVWLGYFLSKRQTKDQFLMETRRTIYAKLLSAVVSEESYPNEPHDRMSEGKIVEYNERLNEWRRNRKIIKGLAVEALLITRNEVLRNKLSEFISSPNPDSRLLNLEEMMREEIGI